MRYAETQRAKCLASMSVETDFVGIAGIPTHEWGCRRRQRRAEAADEDDTMDAIEEALQEEDAAVTKVALEEDVKQLQVRNIHQTSNFKTWCISLSVQRDAANQ